MKKLIILSLTLLISGASFTQQKKLYIGVTGALQNTWILCSTDFDEGGILDFKSTIKSAVGLDLGYQINPEISIQTGLIYSLQGQNYITAGNTNANFYTDLSYLKIPLLLCYYIRPESKVTIVTQVGFQMSLLATAQSSRLLIFGPYSPLYQDVKDSYSGSSLDAVVGFGIQYKLKQMNFSLLLRADYSLTDIEKTEKKPGLRSPASNFTWTIPQLGFHYYF